MTTTTGVATETSRSLPRRTPGFVHRHEKFRLAGLLTAPMGWLVIAYLGSLVAMLVAAFWSIDDFTGKIIKTTTLDNFRTLVQDPVYRRIAVRSLEVAGTVTIVDAIIALPMAYFMAKVASPRLRRLLVVAVLTPLWASYLVKAYAWRVMLSNGGVIDWALRPFGNGRPGYGLEATLLTLPYPWMPLMNLLIVAGLV